MRYFVAVAEREHFTRAAEDLHVSQPHLSRLVRSLEHELGVTLIQRTTRSVQLTPAGRVLRDRLSRALDDIDAACEECRSVHAGFRGRLRLGFVGSVTYSWLPLLVRSFRRKYPDVQVEIFSEMLTGPQVTALHDDAIDVGVMRARADHDNLNELVLAREGLVVALPSEHAQAAADTVDLRELADERFMMYADQAGSTTYRLVLESCLRAGFAPQITQTADDTHTLISLVAANMGVALLPESATTFAVNGVCYRPLGPDYPRLDLVACWSRDISSDPLTRNFVDLCRQLARAEPA